MTGVLAPLRGAAMAPRTGGGPALVAVAHGSRDPRSAATMAAVVADVAAARPDLTVRLAFLDLNAPSVEQVTDDLAAQGHTSAIVVPLLLGNAFHARFDLPALLSEAMRRIPRLRLTQADVLGADPRLLAALADRVTYAVNGRPVASGLRSADTAVPHIDTLPGTPGALVRTFGSAGPSPELGIAVAAVGSRNAAANRRTAAVARRLAASTGLRTEICFATVHPGITMAVDRLRARGAEHIVVAPWFLAPGLLTDRLRTAAPDLVHAAVIGAHSALTEVIWARYDSTIAAELELSA